MAMEAGIDILNAEPERERLLKMKHVKEMFDCSHTHIYSLMAAGKFPKQRKLGETAVWRYSELAQHIANMFKTS